MNESVSDAEVPLSILSYFVLHRYVKVFEIFGALSVLLGACIQDMCNALFNKFFCLESSLEWSHINAWVHLKQIYLLKGHGAVDFASADGQMWETAANNVFFVKKFEHYSEQDEPDPVRRN